MASLYRKWRSRSFDDLVGQEHVVRTLRNAVQHGRVAHAYLFTGPRGTGKTSTARILAKAVNCLHPQEGSPCNECEKCRAADEGRAFDVIEIDAASNTSVDNVRELRERVGYAAGEGRFKFYIVDEVHRLSAAAFDAFLKTLEEPPPHVIFVFASTEPHKVPETIMSRCQRLDFNRIAPGDTMARLQFVARQENLDVTEDALVLVSQHAHGSLRDALGLLDQVASYSDGAITDAGVRNSLGLADSTLIATLSESLLDRRTGDGLSAFHDFVAAGGDPAQLTRQFVDYWRALLLRVAGAGSADAVVDPALREPLRSHAGRVDEARVVSVLRAMTDQEFSSKFNLPSELPFEVGYVQAGLAVGNGQVSAFMPAAGREIQRPSETLRSSPQTAAERQPAPREELRPMAPRAAEAVPPAGPPPAPVHENLTVVPPAARPAGDVDGAWPDIVAAMRNKSQSLQAVLRGGYVMKAENGEIVVGFLHDFHRNQFSDPKKRKLLEEVVEEVLGVSYRVTCVRATKEEVEAARGEGTFDHDDGFVEEVTERLRDYHLRQYGGGQI